MFIIQSKIIIFFIIFSWVSVAKASECNLEVGYVSYFWQSVDDIDEPYREYNLDLDSNPEQYTDLKHMRKIKNTGGLNVQIYYWDKDGDQDETIKEGESEEISGDLKKIVCLAPQRGSSIDLGNGVDSSGDKSIKECKILIKYASWFGGGSEERDITGSKRYNIPVGSDLDVNVDHMRVIDNYGPHDAIFDYDYGFWNSGRTIVRKEEIVKQSGNLKKIKCPDPYQNIPQELVAVNLKHPDLGPSTTEPTPFVQVQWTDNSDKETGYTIILRSTSNIGQGNFIFDHLASSDAQYTPNNPDNESRMSLKIKDLPRGRYTFSVCAKLDYITDHCDLIGPEFEISEDPINRCKPKIISVEKSGTNASTSNSAKIEWSYTTCLNDPTNFFVRLRCHNSPFGIVENTLNGTARHATFNFGVGKGVVQVCASHQMKNICSLIQPFNCY